MMNKETLKFIREMSYFSSLGLSVALAIVIGLGLGVYLDRRFDTHPWLTFIGLGFGIAAGYRNIWLAHQKSQRM
ncbi:AtpZ/AtpI family protein [Desulfatibacillum aliphaticivorans]|nr:AtpZ/AtpI family protein [Desulfatibacillum aliphaticivorans]